MRLLKILLLNGIILMISKSSFAQVKVEIGFKAGLNYSNLNLSLTGRPDWFYKYSRVDNYYWTVGYHLGGYASIKFSKFALQPEIVFSRQGQGFNFYNTGKLNTEINYINIPILLKYYLVNNLNLQIGPQLGLLTSASGYVYNTHNGVVTNQSIASLIQSTDFSIAFGAGWELPFGFSLTTRYNIGLSDVSQYSDSQIPEGVIPEGGTTPIGTVQAKNQVFQLSFGYKFFNTSK